MRTLLELSDGLVSNAFGTHLGYGVALGARLHWIEAKPSRISRPWPAPRLRRRPLSGPNGSG